MGLLDHLWDDTVAGPPPEHGLGRLRKFKSFGFPSSSSSKESASGGGVMKTYGDETPPEAGLRVTRSITIVRPPGNQTVSPPVSPAGSTPPVSPFSGDGRAPFRFRRRSMSDAYEKPSEVRPPGPPPPYDS